MVYKNNLNTHINNKAICLSSNDEYAILPKIFVKVLNMF